ncbi:putative DNA-binding domain-containing protein [Pseudidiomarina sp. 1APP75-32.1]|uniref:DNA-binding domain-containing protein n=1 Tax=Pseudidiomarina terrestris TaxID=2820060 RepID=A0AAW7QTB5_9GAMM|nr:putative DNA-binding domain-containing protein [Pseudidiomarina sp. 1APP75-32.1]MDN7123397.1 putative DNA-binding domain-containing protein [Pseudidiomarina sp. 1APP75-32.1]
MSKQFQQTQLEFARWLRSPNAADEKFADIEQRRLAIYRRLIHANIKQFVATGFPVLHQLLTQEQWRNLLASFVAQHRSDSPLFSDIGTEFVAFLASGKLADADYPQWLFDLARYERMEVDVQFAHLDDAFQPLNEIDEGTTLHVNPTAQVGIFDYPVAQINADFRPTAALDVPYFVLVYQSPEGRVQFLELNSLTALAIDLLQQKPRNLMQLSEALATQLPDFTEQQLQQGFGSVAVDFAERFVLLDKP